MSSSHFANSTNSSKARNSASTKTPQERKQLAIEAMAKTSTISQLASKTDTSRKFIYAQKQKAENALDEAFTLNTGADDFVLFYLPITKAWIHRFILAIILICHGSLRNVCEILKDLFNIEISIGTVHNVVERAVKAARMRNAEEDLASIKVGAHDEIFQGRDPVLVGCDAVSTYCYLLSAVEARDAETWGIALLEASDRGLKPDYTIGDGGQGLRAGQALVWSNIPFHGDVFHALHDLGKAAMYLENRAYGALSTKEGLERKVSKAKKKNRGNTLSRKLGYAREGCDQAIALSDDIRMLFQWLQNDVLALVGPDFRTREELFDFIVSELQSRESQAPHRIGPVRRKLENQKDDLLKSFGLIDQKLAEISESYGVDIWYVRQVLLLENPWLTLFQKEGLEKRTRQALRFQFYGIQQAVKEVLSEIVRASSVIENLNSRLRNYFFLRKQIGPAYLDLLRFFLNHRRFIRSEHPDRVGKSPCEIMTGQPHPHWLDLLGLPPCRLAA
jgi:hypothetical protein